MSCNVGSAFKNKATGEARGLKEKRKKKTKMGLFSHHLGRTVKKKVKTH